MAKPTLAWKLFAAAALWLAWTLAPAQSLPVSVSVSGDTATVTVGSGSVPLADLTLSFDDASGLSASSLGISAQLVSLTDTALLARLPNLSLTQLDPAFPLLITIEPPALGGLSFHRSVRVEVHTHALSYSPGSSLRLFKAPLGGAFRDITDEVAPGSVRARGTTGGFSQFLVLPDLRGTDAVVAQKIAWLRARIDLLPASEQAAFDLLLDEAETAVAAEDYTDAIAALDDFRSRATTRAGLYLGDRWRAARDLDNHAGELIAGAATLKFSVAYLRDFGP
ncbi:DUF6689 family protein [Lysobacter firmicutimachus]|uniref:DUF6689 family protein n=1 Tax=Lysobacter firmicutimachus TaxID=1792846 RepID=A0AAU8MYR4_9GAMM